MWGGWAEETRLGFGSNRQRAAWLKRDGAPCVIIPYALWCCFTRGEAHARCVFARCVVLLPVAEAWLDADHGAAVQAEA